jgi:fructose-bisphosphate aldolase class I
MSNLKGIDKYKDELIKNACYIVQKGKGILAADESTGTIGKRFAGANVENTEKNRRAYRELLFTAPGLEQYISGTILYDEIVYQKTKEGKRFIEVLSSKGILPGIKVDKGTIPIINSENETFTQGLDDLGKRCAKYYEEGCRFSKWRAVFRIGKNTPSLNAIKENAAGLARFAIISQENGLVPIVEPEVLCEGEHDIDECANKSEKVFHEVFNTLFDYGVLFEGMLLKPNMIIPGQDCKNKVKPEEIALKTVKALCRIVPAAVPGIVFLSGGQSEYEASVNLNCMNLLKDIRIPWNLSFSYGRALQYSCLKAWAGKNENSKKAQNILLQMAKNNSEATKGMFKGNGKK